MRPGHLKGENIIMCQSPSSPEKAQSEFHKCCGRCPQARKAAAEGTRMEPHSSCAPRVQMGADEPQAAPVLR